MTTRRNWLSLAKFSGSLGLATLALFSSNAVFADTVNFTLTEEYNGNPQDTDTFNGTIIGLTQGLNYGSQVKIGLNTSPASNFDGFSFGDAQNLLLTEGQNQLDFTVSGTQVTAESGNFGTATAPDGSFINLILATSAGGANSFYLGADGFCGATACNKAYTTGAGAVQTVTFSNYTVTSNPVPLPAAAWLLVSGIGGIGALARKKRTA